MNSATNSATEISDSAGALWGLTVGRKLAAIPALFVLAIAAILIYTVLTAQDQKLDAFLIDMAARQRMLVQRELVQVLLVDRSGRNPIPATGSPTREAMLGVTESTDYRATRQLMAESLAALIDGGTVIDLVSGTNREIPATGNRELQSNFRDEQKSLSDFHAAVDVFLKLSEDDPEYADALTKMLVRATVANDSAVAALKTLTAASQAKIAAMIWWETAISFAAIALGVAFSWLVTRGIVVPLAGVVALAQDIGRGNLRGEKLRVASSDEVGRLALRFNQMLDNLRELASQTAGISTNLNSASSEILASTQQQAAGTKEQAATIQEITTTMEEVRQSGAQISDRAKQVATAAEASATTTVSGLSAVQETNRTMEAIRVQVEEVAEKIVALSEKTQSVSEIIATVNDIAERSNLLALNAAIEAAAAGKQGNRFSVVANEIKNLADQAKDSTVQVRTILGDIQKGINSSVMLTEEAVKRVDIGKQRAEVTEQTIRRMADTMQESVQAFQQIIGATNQQQIGFEQVTQGMQDIRQAATQTATGTLQLEKAAANLNSQSQQLSEAVGRYQL
jgi:methyl-accepting chemotaxis protein